jgi:SOS-response transcriptional repressor LexA
MTRTAARPHKPLTARQKDVLRWFVAYAADHQCPPTLREAADGLGIASTNGMVTTFDALVVKGWLTCLPRTARGYRLAPWLVGKTPAEVVLLIDTAPTAARVTR